MLAAELWSCLLLLFLYPSHLKGVNGSEAEYNLLQTLFVRYDPNNRPVANVSGIVTVTMDLAINQIINLDETQELLKTKLWVRLDWKDVHLRWDPKDYEEMQHINVAPAKIWTPDITLYHE